MNKRASPGRFFRVPRDGEGSKKIFLLNVAGMVLLLGAALYGGFRSLDYDLAWDRVWEYRASLILGFRMTILISLGSLFLSTVIGLFFGLAQGSAILPLRLFARFYIEIIRGSPLLVQILIFFYVIANSLGINNRYIAGILIMSLFAGAYISEIIRASVEGVGESQWESARAIGLTRGQTYRLVVLPQVITRVLPPLAGQFASLVKDSSLLSIIAVKEFTMAAREINAATFSTLESYIPLALGYLALTIPLSLLTRKLEGKYSYDT